MSTVSVIQRYGATVLHTSGLKGSRHILDMFADRVLDGSKRARTACVRVIRSAQAQ